VGATHTVAIGSGLTVVWLISWCGSAANSCDLSGLAFLALFALATAGVTLSISAPAARRLVYRRFRGTTRAISWYFMVTVGIRFLFVVPPLWVLGLVDVAVVDTLLPDANAAAFIAVTAGAHGMGAFLFALVSLRGAAALETVEG
jgi:hypothetical protein